MDSCRLTVLGGRTPNLPARVWGDPFMMTNDEVAKRLGVAESDLEQIVADTNAALGWNGPRCHLE